MLFEHARDRFLRKTPRGLARPRATFANSVLEPGKNLSDRFEEGRKRESAPRIERHIGESGESLNTIEKSTARVLLEILDFSIAAMVRD